MLNYLKKLFYILPASKISLIRILFLFLLTSGLEVIGIGVVGSFIGLASNPELIHENPYIEWLFQNSGIEQGNQFLGLLGFVVIIVFCSKSCIAWFTQAYIARFSNRQQRLLIVKMVREYLATPYIYHTQKNTSSIVDSVIEISNTFTNVILTPLLTTIVNTFVSIALFSLLCATSLSTMVVLLAVLLPVFIFFNSFKVRIQRWGRQKRQSKENIIKIINHAFGGIKETKVIGCEAYFEQQIITQAKQLEHSHCNFVTFKILPRFAIEGVILTSIVGILSIALLFNIGIDNLTSMLGVYALASIRLLPAISNSINGINQLRNSSYTTSQIYADLVELERRKHKGNLIPYQTFSQPVSESCSSSAFSEHLRFYKEITLTNISYKYPNASSQAISDISLTIGKGESVAFIGKSGAGKTTLVDIMLSLLIPQHGDIKIDGISIYQNLRDWQNLIGYIPQSIFLTDDTLERNIAFGVPDALIDHDRLQKAIQAAQLTEVIEKLPNGIKTVVGERGILLSGGQRQRVGIARALYHEREILVLDEATAALDNETEKLVTEAIKLLSGKKTIIMIAHRLTTVEHCDCIYLLEHGRILKSGQYKDVVLGSM